MLFFLLGFCLLLSSIAEGAPGSVRKSHNTEQCITQCSENYTDQWAALVSSKLVAVLTKNDTLLSQMKTVKGDMCRYEVSDLAKIKIN
ncbi:unnamed protein product [Soboliphyme baturini]|uniref:Secreted protein n=1 Tax=Soboliphyme baturini TaxID=241478 RepID=A0A183I9X2_9BILA|nr:unnamed protein product [Soboliphyme baturini]